MVVTHEQETGSGNLHELFASRIDTSFEVHASCCWFKHDIILCALVGRLCFDRNWHELASNFPCKKLTQVSGRRPHQFLVYQILERADIALNNRVEIQKIIVSRSSALWNLWICCTNRWHRQDLVRRGAQN